MVTNLEASPKPSTTSTLGEAENRIKDLKNALFANRLSCLSFTANCFRLMVDEPASARRNVCGLMRKMSRVRRFLRANPAAVASG